MNRPFLDFIRSGAVGELILGLGSSDIITKLGEPVSWLGRPPCFGPIVSDFARATTWFYYDGAVGVGFDQLNVAVEISVTPDKVVSRAPFGNWPILPGVTVARYRRYLVENNVPFYEESDPEDIHYILAEKGCVALCAPYENGKEIPPDHRPLTMITTVANDELLPGFVKGKH